MLFSWKKNNHTRTNNAQPENEITYGCTVYSLTETGPTRTSNEDCILSFYPDRDHETVFAMVADGMGGHNAGEIASGIACASARNYVQTNHTATDSQDMLEQLLHYINSNILEAAAANNEYTGMGTTATMVLVRKQQLFFGHIGDSRLYYHNGKSLTQCTKDTTLVQQMVEEGKITAEEADTHQMKNVLTQALGTMNEISPATGKHSATLKPGDSFFMCSDGIYDVLNREELEQLLGLQPAMAMECIKALCMQRKASDNFSAILVKIVAEKRLSEPVTREQNVML